MSSNSMDAEIAIINAKADAFLKDGKLSQLEVEIIYHLTEAVKLAVQQGQVDYNLILLLGRAIRCFQPFKLETVDI